MWLDRGQDGVNREDVGRVALGGILAFPDPEEKLLEGFEQSDLLCLVLSFSVAAEQGADQSGVECHRAAELTVAPARVLACGHCERWSGRRSELTRVPKDWRGMEVREGRPGQLPVSHLSLRKKWPGSEVWGGRQVSRPG